MEDGLHKRKQLFKDGKIKNYTCVIEHRENQKNIHKTIYH